MTGKPETVEYAIQILDTMEEEYGWEIIRGSRSEDYEEVLANITYFRNNSDKIYNNRFQYRLVKLIIVIIEDRH